MDFKYIGCEIRTEFKTAEDRVKWRVVTNKVLSISVI
jgi:hypothetical protein